MELGSTDSRTNGQLVGKACPRTRKQEVVPVLSENGLYIDGSIDISVEQLAPGTGGLAVDVRPRFNTVQGEGLWMHRGDRRP